VPHSSPVPHGLEWDGAAQELRDRLENGLLQRLEDIGVNAGNAPRVPNTTNLWFDHLEGEALVIALDLKGLAVSGGSACASGAAEPSHVLTAMGLPRSRQSQPPLQPDEIFDTGRSGCRHRNCRSLGGTTA
jgi:cysteine sulfinate desulfinase/cysteine desulfurase-like protein